MNTEREVGVYVDLTYLNRKPAQVEKKEPSAIERWVTVGTHFILERKGRDYQAAIRIPVSFA